MTTPHSARRWPPGRREEFAAFGWHPHEVPDPQAHDTFERSKLNWDELAREPHAELLDWHRRLIRLRREVPALADGRLDRVRVDYDEEARWLVVERGPVAVACNLADRVQCVPVRLPWASQALLTSDPAVQITADGVTLPPDAVALLGPPSCARRDGGVVGCGRGPQWCVTNPGPPHCPHRGVGGGLPGGSESRPRNTPAWVSAAVALVRRQGAADPLHCADGGRALSVRPHRSPTGPFSRWHTVRASRRPMFSR